MNGTAAPDRSPAGGHQYAPASEQLPKLLTVPETAAALRVSRSTVYELLQSGRLRGVKIGRRRLVAASEITEIIRRGYAA
jgi:excisionase family DNA binding protein